MQVSKYRRLIWTTYRPVKPCEGLASPPGCIPALRPMIPETSYKQKEAEATHIPCDQVPEMDSAKLSLKLLAMGYIFTVCLAVDCNWYTQYEYKGKCCDACPPGQYPKDFCSTVCEVCTDKDAAKCPCTKSHLYGDEDVLKCVDRPTCKPGEELKRSGRFSYNYYCNKCPNNTYSAMEDSMCEPITDCRKFGLDVLFPGNITHNAKCGWQSPEPRQDTFNSTLDSYQLTLKAIVVCLAINSVMCMALMFNACIGRSTDRRKKNKSHSTTRSLILPSEDCSCKLSKEEKGDPSESFSDVSDASTSNCEV
ncbi:tumor necrosis factor receptor superfamily member 18 [Hoplias malabaricus]|uniref:tumor necrosis factor receptor superfamily member 18 n=1 Tax=Hoplias malabaricus TaxID=27720 RepID=UPI00346312B4